MRMTVKKTKNTQWIRAAKLAELEAQAIQRVAGTRPPITVFLHDGKVSAVDNRCPHLGFPLHRGTVNDGVLTCHWHHANYDLCSGCSYSQFADDLVVFDTKIENDIVCGVVSTEKKAIDWIEAEYPSEGRMYARCEVDGKLQGDTLFLGKVEYGPKEAMQ